MSKFNVAFPLSGRKGERHDVSNARPGGADLSTLGLAKELKSRGHNPLILVHNDGPTVGYVENLGLEVVPLGFESLNKRKPITDNLITAIHSNSTGVSELLRSHGIEIVHTNDASLHRTWGFIRQKVKFKHVWHERGLFSHPEEALPLLHSANKVITISNFVKRLAPEEMRDSVQVIDNPISISEDIDKMNNRRWLLKELGLDESALVFVMIANANTRKRWPIYFEAAAKAAAANSRLHFCCVGNVDHKSIDEMLDNYWKSSSGANIHVMGYRYDAINIVSGCDVLVSTSTKEPLGRTIVEGVLSRTAVLASNSGAHRELFRDRAPEFLVEPDTADEFYRRFLDAEDFLARSTNDLAETRKKFRARFDPRRHADQILDVYAGL